MAFSKKSGKASPWLDDPIGQAQKTQSGNPDANLSSPEHCYSSGIPKVSPTGSYTDNAKVMNWPYQGFTTDNEAAPKLNQFPVPQLSGNPQTFKDDGAAPRSASRATLG